MMAAVAVAEMAVLQLAIGMDGMAWTRSAHCDDPTSSAEKLRFVNGVASSTNAAWIDIDRVDRVGGVVAVVVVVVAVMVVVAAAASVTARSRRQPAAAAAVAAATVAIRHGPTLPFFCPISLQFRRQRCHHRSNRCELTASHSNGRPL